MRYLVFILLIFLPLICLPQDIILEPIFIEKSFRSAASASSDYFYPDDVQALPFFSLEEIIDYSSSVDLRKRSRFGIQQDVSLRGSSFEDSVIRVQGLKLNDPQTGHFNLELPFTAADIEVAEVLKNSQQINFGLKKPEAQGGFFRSFFGQHALAEQLISVNFPLADFNNRISIGHKASSGSKQDSDFEIYNFSYHSLLEDQAKVVEFIFGSSQRDFGAADFYSASFPHQEEHTAQQLFSLSGKLKREYLDLSSRVYFRRHADQFILNRHDPSFYTNFHTTYVYGLANEFDFTNNIFATLAIAREKVTSTNLDKHQRSNKGLSLGLREKRIGKLAFDFESGFDYCQDWGYLDNSRLSLRYFLQDNLSLHFSFDRIWRKPSFTELYYLSPSDLGNSNLRVQRSNNFEIGGDFFPVKGFRLSLNSFLRDQHQTIDWVKNIYSDPWQADNVGNIRAYGFDCSLEAGFNDFLLRKINIGYSYLTLGQDNPYGFSKYVFDYDRHKIVTRFNFYLKGVELNPIVNFANPVARKTYTTVDLKATKKFGDFSVILEGNNIFNRGYQEMTDISSSGRWYKIGFSHSF